MQITICDICETRDDVNRVSFCYDRKTDAAGSMEDVCEVFDLCNKCELSVLRRAIALYKKSKKIDGYEFNKEIIKIVKEKQNAKTRKEIGW